MQRCSSTFARMGTSGQTNDACISRTILSSLQPLLKMHQEPPMQIVPWTSDLARMLAPMFTGDRPIPIRLWAVLDGSIVGRIVVDQLPHPTLALVQEMAEGTTYIAGTPAPRMLTDAFTLLRITKKVVVCLWPADPL